MKDAEILKGRWTDISTILSRSGPFAGPGFKPDTKEDPKGMKFLQEGSKVLVIGAGGLGCEILKNLALSGFRNIEVIDMDTIDATNLNRQFLFRAKDVGGAKATTAAKFINERVPGAKVVGHLCKIQDKDEEYYQGFNMVVCGLDSIRARRWMNSMLCGLVIEDDDGEIDTTTMIPFIDGGTEGFKGQARVILPLVSACIECSLDAFPKQKTFQICTIASKPRSAAHCIQWAKLIAWDKAKPFGEEKGSAIPINTDDPKQMKWIFEKAVARAKEFDIEGVTYKKTQAVVKNIIPAIASTNALVSAACTNEALKIATNCSQYLNNWMMYTGDSAVYTYTYERARKDDCAVCGKSVMKMTRPKDETVGEFLDHLKEAPETQFTLPSLLLEDETIYMPAPEVLEKQYRPNLSKKLSEVGIVTGAVVDVTDPALGDGGLEIEITLA